MFEKEVHQGSQRDEKLFDTCVRYECDQCELKLSERDTLIKHKMSMHEEAIYACAECDYLFSKKEDLKKHKTTHGNG